MAYVVTLAPNHPGLVVTQAEMKSRAPHPRAFHGEWNHELRFPWLLQGGD
jgi:hypothetical protein